MPKTKRLQVPVKPEIEQLLIEYADVLGMSVPAACSKLLEQSAPGLGELSKALKQASSSPAKALRQMAKMVDKVSTDVDQMAMDIQPPKRAKK